MREPRRPGLHRQAVFAFLVCGGAIIADRQHGFRPPKPIDPAFKKAPLAGESNSYTAILNDDDPRSTQRMRPPVSLRGGYGSI